MKLSDTDPAIVARFIPNENPRHNVGSLSIGIILFYHRLTEKGEPPTKKKKKSGKCLRF